MDPAQPKRPALRSVLGDHVKDYLLQAIFTGKYPPGARIVETRVAREVGVSQSPVREALRDLAALGIVETSAFRGARVRRPSPAELLEAFAVRTELEVLAARLALPNVTDADLERLAGFVEQMHQGARERDPYAEAVADAAFHAEIVELAGNAVLQRVWHTLEPFPRTYITIAIHGDDRHEIADRHWPILEAFRSRDPERAADAIRRHFEEAAALTASQGPSTTDRASATVPPERPGGKRAGN
jgi:DNA-binding GntR family transcriptional regulator